MSKWYFIMVAVLFSGLCGSMAFSEYSKNQMNKEIMVACLKSNRTDCNKILLK